MHSPPGSPRNLTAVISSWRAPQSAWGACAPAELARPWGAASPPMRRPRFLQLLGQHVRLGRRQRETESGWQEAWAGGCSAGDPEGHCPLLALSFPILKWTQGPPLGVFTHSQERVARRPNNGRVRGEVGVRGRTEAWLAGDRNPSTDPGLRLAKDASQALRCSLWPGLRSFAWKSQLKQSDGSPGRGQDVRHMALLGAHHLGPSFPTLGLSSYICVSLHTP